MENATTKTPMTDERAWLAISAHTGIFVANMPEFQEYCSEILGYPIWSHELGKEEVFKEIQLASSAEFKLALDFLKTAANKDEAVLELIMDIKLEPWSCRHSILELYVKKGHNPEIVKVLAKQLKDGSWMD